jgi:SNF2-related domain
VVDQTVREDQILVGALFSEPMRVVTVKSDDGTATWLLGLVGVQSERFRSVTLTEGDLRELKIQNPTSSYSGDCELRRPGRQAYSLGIAYGFDPYFDLSISRVDPPPRQLEAVYHYQLKLARARFLLADDAGAGKTIMAGLQLREKFDERFIVLKGAAISNQSGINQWLQNRQVITSLDLAKRNTIPPGIQQVHWDVVIVDEAHRMSWSPPARKTARYALGELLRDHSDHILLLTATPHKGDPEHLSRFLQLLDEDAYADVKSIGQAIEQRSAPFYLRRTKEAMVYFPDRQPLGGKFETSELTEVASKVRAADDEARDEVWASYRFIAFADPKCPDGLKCVGLGAGHSRGSKSLCDRVPGALKSNALLNESPGAGYLERRWPEAFKATGAWPIKSLPQAFLEGSLERLINADEYLKRKVPEFVARDDFRLASGDQAAGGYQRIWFNEPVSADKVSFDADVDLLKKEKAKALRAESAVAEVPSGPSVSKAEETARLPEAQSVTVAASAKSVVLTGVIPPALWNKVGIRLIPSLRSNAQLTLGVNSPLEIESGHAANLLRAIQQALAALELTAKIKIEVG